MSWFGLDPRSIVERVYAAPKTVRIPTLFESVVRGAVGFALVSVAGFTPWVLAGKWFYRNPGEPAMYAACALVFIILSGLALHRMIIGPGSLPRFYAFFGAAFLLYSIGWTVGWMALRGHSGSLAGLAAGTAMMAVMFGIAFEAKSRIADVAAVLFASNALGYFVGGWIEGYLSHQSAVNVAGIVLEGNALVVFMKYMWAVCYGLGLGAGLGYAFYACQTGVRALLKTR